MIGSISDLCLLPSSPRILEVDGGIDSQLNPIPHVKPPRTSGDDVYRNVCESIKSITGHTTRLRFSSILSINGSSQKRLTSQWLSRNTRASPTAERAPNNRPLMSPSRRLALMIWIATPWSLIVFWMKDSTVFKSAKEVWKEYLYWYKISWIFNFKPEQRHIQ